MQSLNELVATPLSGAPGGSGQLLANLATIRRDTAAAVVSHYDAQPVIDIYGSAQDADLGFIATQVDRLIAESHAALPHGVPGSHARPGADHAGFLQWTAVGAAWGGRAGVSSDRREFPVLAGPLRDHHGAAGRARRHRVDACFSPIRR